jgi:type II secretory ATPase GspE/PulE/Tfp pilus assembly ATPase PilB-like protein
MDTLVANCVKIRVTRGRLELSGHADFQRRGAAYYEKWHGNRHYDQAVREGVRDLRQSGLLKVKYGHTSLEEIEAVTNE